MTFVLDTDVVSAVRVRGRNLVVERWMESVPAGEQFVTSFTIAEIERGVAAMERSDSDQGLLLRRWFEEAVLPAFAGRVLAFDLHAARAFARYRVPQLAPIDDAQIAAVAEANGKTVVTRNVRHFEPLGVPCLDPWTLSGS